jgi:hypothetical protein
MARHSCLQGKSFRFAAHETADADLFSAIRDSGYKHALRLYRDKKTEAVRLEAAVLDKEMKE